MLSDVDASDWDDRYRSRNAPWGNQPNRTVHARVAGRDPGRAVDLACGDGRHARWLARRGWRVSAVDFAGVAVDRARAEDPDSRVEWITADVTGWRPDGPVDLALVAYLHLPMPELVGFLRRAGSWLAPGGHLLYVGHARENHTRGVGGPPDPAILPGIQDLAGATAGLCTVELGHQLRATDRGTAIDVVLDVTPWGEHDQPGGGAADDPH